MNPCMEVFSNVGYWMKGFKRQTYEKYLEAFCQQYTDTFRTALQENTPETLAGEVLNELDAGWKTLRFWNRSGAKTETKLLLITYVSPLLLLAEEPRCSQLAEALCRSWNERWPGDPYQLPDVDKLKNSFKNAVFGINLEKTGKRENGRKGDPTAR